MVGLAVWACRLLARQLTPPGEPPAVRPAELVLPFAWFATLSGGIGSYLVALPNSRNVELALALLVIALAGTPFPLPRWPVLVAAPDGGAARRAVGRRPVRGVPGGRAAGTRRGRVVAQARRPGRPEPAAARGRGGAAGIPGADPPGALAAGLRRRDHGPRRDRAHVRPPSDPRAHAHPRAGRAGPLGCSTRHADGDRSRTCSASPSSCSARPRRCSSWCGDRAAARWACSCSACTPLCRRRGARQPDDYNFHAGRITWCWDSSTSPPASPSPRQRSHRLSAGRRPAPRRRRRRCPRRPALRHHCRADRARLTAKVSSPPAPGRPPPAPISSRPAAGADRDAAAAPGGRGRGHHRGGTLPFWSADLYTHLSSGQVQVSDVGCDGGRLRHRDWLTDTARLRVRGPRTFVLLPATPELRGCGEQAVVRQLGQPVSRWSTPSGAVLLVFDGDS